MPGAAKPSITASTRALASVLRAERARRTPPLSQTELAERVGISQGQISKILSGKVAPNLDELTLICHALGRGVLDVMAEALADAEADVRTRLTKGERAKLDVAKERTNKPKGKRQPRQDRDTGS